MHDNELSSTSRSSSPDTPADDSGNNEKVSLFSDSNFWSSSPLTHVKPQPPQTSWGIQAQQMKQEPDLGLLLSEVIRDELLLDQPVVNNISHPSTSSPDSTLANGDFSHSQSRPHSASLPVTTPTCSSQPTSDPVLNDNQAQLSRTQIASFPGRVVYPVKETCANLPIVFPNIPESGTKSRVETQIRVMIDLAYSTGSSDELLGKTYDRVGSWACLRLPPGTSTRRRPRKDPKIEANSEDTLYLETSISCASAPHLRVTACTSCQNREAKRLARKIAARVRPSRSDEEEQAPIPIALENEGDAGRDGSGIVQFNCADTVDFSDGSITLPLRITCYCRHHREKVGFRVTFVILDHSGKVVGKGTTPPIMITDDHKTTSKTVPSTDAELEGYSRQISHRGQTSYAPVPRKRKNKPYDGARPMSSRSSPSHSKESTPFSQGIPTTPSAESTSYNPLVEAATIHDSGMKIEPPMYPTEFSTASMQQPPIIQPSSGYASHSEIDPTTIPFPFFALPSEAMSTSCPRIQRLIPSSGPVHGGIEITILGSGFRSDLQLSVLFGGQRATFTQRWSDNALVCLLPAASVAGVVPVSFEGFEVEGNQASLFTYLDDNERALMELALQVVGLKMTGKIENAKDVAMRIVGSGNDETFSSAPIDPSEITQMASGLGSVQGLEDLLLSLLTMLDFSSKSGLPVTAALSLRSSTHHNLLHLAVQSRLSRLVTSLLVRGADSDARDRNGLTSLHFAVLAKWQEGVDLLLQYGTDWQIVDALGRTPAQYVDASSISFDVDERERDGRDISDAGEEADIEDESESEAPRRRRSGLNVEREPSSEVSGKMAPDDKTSQPERSEKESEPEEMQTSEPNPKQDVVIPPPNFYNRIWDSLAAFQASAAFPKGLPQINQIYPMNLPKQLPFPQLPELPRLPQLPAVFPVYIPIPWPTLNRAEQNDRQHNVEGVEGNPPPNPELISIWKAAWEKCLAQMTQSSADSGPSSPTINDPPPVYSETPEGEPSSIATASGSGGGDTKLRKRKSISGPTPPVVESNAPREDVTFKYRASRMEERPGARDKMLLWFWLPALILGLIWAISLSIGPIAVFLSEANWR